MTQTNDQTTANYRWVIYSETEARRQDGKGYWHRDTECWGELNETAIFTSEELGQYVLPMPFGHDQTWTELGLAQLTTKDELMAALAEYNVDQTPIPDPMALAMERRAHYRSAWLAQWLRTCNRLEIDLP